LSRLTVCYDRLYSVFGYVLSLFRKMSSLGKGMNDARIKEVEFRRGNRLSVFWFLTKMYGWIEAQVERQVGETRRFAWH